MEKKIRGGALIARALKEKGIDKVFTLAGGFCNPALEGFMKCQMSVINCPHEQVAGHLADGHTRISRKPSVCLVGPEGFANAVPAMLEAGGERSPVIFVTGSSDVYVVDVYNHRIQKKGQLVTVAKGKYLGTTAAIVGLTECMVHLVGVDGRRFRVSRCSLGGAFHWKRRNKLGEAQVQVPTWWGRWLFTGIRV